MTKIVAIANQKGGVGKTTTSINLAASLAVYGESVLLIDIDPQGNATSGLGIDPLRVRLTIYDCLLRSVAPKEVVQNTAVSGLSVLPANADLAGAEVELVGIENRESILKQICAQLVGSCTFVLIDCPPALGLLTINALVAATSILVPVQCEYYAMEGLGRLMSNVRRVQDSFNHILDLEGIVLTMFDSRNSLSRQVAEEIRGHFQDKVYRTVIPRNVTLAEAPSYGRPGILYNANSTGTQAYLALAKELVGHGEKGAREGT